MKLGGEHEHKQTHARKQLKGREKGSTVGAVERAEEGLAVADKHC